MVYIKKLTKQEKVLNNCEDYTHLQYEMNIKHHKDIWDETIEKIKESNDRCEIQNYIQQLIDDRKNWNKYEIEHEQLLNTLSDIKDDLK